MGSLIITCGCGQRMKVAAELAGKTVKCVRCGEPLRVDTASAASPKPTPPQETAVPKPAPSRRLRTDESVAKDIGALLLDDGLLTPEQLDELREAERQGGRFLDIALEKGLLDSARLHDFLSRRSGVAGIDLQNYHIPRELAPIVPREFAAQRHVIPIDKLGKLLTVGMACPLDATTIRELEEITGLKVKPVLCKLDDVRAAVDRYYPSDAVKRPAAPPPVVKTVERRPRTVLAQEEVTTRLSQLDSLPILAGAVSRITRTVERPRNSIRELDEVVRTEPAVVARLLSAANCSVYGMPGRVADIGLASTLLGVDGVCGVVMSARVIADADALGGFNYDAFHVSSLFCGTAARQIAGVRNRRLAPSAFAAGLLHEIGRLALADLYPELCASLNGGLAGPELLRMEEELFGMPHPDAGYLLARGWNLPIELAEPIRCHHAPDLPNDAQDVVSIVALASIMAGMYCSPDAAPDSFPESARPLFEALGLDEARAVSIYEETAAAVARITG